VGEDQGQQVGGSSFHPGMHYGGDNANPRWQKEIRPSDFINNAVNTVIGTPSVSGEEPYILAVDKLEAILTVAMRKKASAFMAERKPELDAIKKDVPASWSENERGWRSYSTAKMLFGCIMQAIYETLPDNRTGVVG